MTHSDKTGCGSWTAKVYIVICGLVLLVFCAFVTNAQAEDLYTDLDTFVGKTADDRAIDFVERPDDNLLIVGLLVDDIVLDEGFLVYLDNEDIILPLGAFVDLLEFPITVNPETGNADGWFIKEENTFKLSRPYKSIKIKDQIYHISSNEIIENHIDDIYVSKDLIEKWFPVKLDFVFQELRIYLSTTEDLPFQSNAKRHSRWDSAKKQSTASGLTHLDKDVIRLPYKKLSFPTVQVSHGFNARESKGDNEITSSHSINIQGDMLGMNLHSNIGYQQSTIGENTIQKSSITLSKEDFEGNLAGFMQATQFELGDTTTYAFPHTPGGTQGRGMKITNAPVNFVRNLNKHLIEGFAPIAWDVEVYQDDRLLDFVTIGSDGRYSFEALPLRVGFNLFHIVMYGPNGEKREEFERFYLGNNMIDTGKLIYEISGIQSASPLLDLKNKKSGETNPSFSVLGEYGVSKNLSATMGYYAGPIGQDDELNGILMGVRGSSKSTFGQFNIFRNHDGGRSISIEATGNLNKNTTWNAGHIRHRGYKKDVRSIHEESFLGFAKTLSLASIPTINYSFNVKRKIDDDGIRSLLLNNRTSGSFLGLNLTNSLEYTIRSTSNIDEILGRLTINKRVPFGSLRGNINYHLHDTANIDSINLQLQNNISQKISLNALLNSILGDDPTNTISLGLDIKLEKYRVGFLSSLSDQGEKTMGMNLSYNFIPQNLSGDYKMSASSSDLSNGHIMLIPFLDLNQDGMRTENEELLAGIKFKNMLRGSKAETNEDGIAVLAGLVPNAVNKITLQEDTLPDIYMAPAFKELKILGKKGVNGPIYIPINQLGEINGVITALDPKTGEEVPLDNIEIYLLDTKDEVVAETTTEYDGFYAFPSLTMGSYEMFFPTSKSLKLYYLGKGTGPRFKLSADEPEITDGDIIVKSEKIRFKDQNLDDSADSLSENTIKKAKNLEFIGLVESPITAKKKGE